MSDSDRRAELIRRVAAHCGAVFGGSFAAMFASADGDGDGRITIAELKLLLAAAGVGTALTRGAWANGVLAELDTDADRSISWDEFSSALGGV